MDRQTTVTRFFQSHLPCLHLSRTRSDVTDTQVPLLFHHILMSVIYRSLCLAAKPEFRHHDFLPLPGCNLKIQKWNIRHCYVKRGPIKNWVSRARIIVIMTVFGALQRNVTKNEVLQSAYNNLNTVERIFMKINDNLYGGNFTEICRLI